GGVLVLLALAGLAAVGIEWATQGFGTLGRAYETALLATLLGLGIQIVFGAFFLALLTMPLANRETVSRLLLDDEVTSMAATANDAHLPRL
ncbi:MAG TPA: hypothetical protein VIG93_08155, partial [Gaiellaceae bacterium]